MSLGAPWALWALPALPLLAVLLLLTMRPRQLVAGTLSIWARLADRHRIEPPSWRHRLRDLLLPLLAAALLVLAASRPRVEAGDQRRLALLLDRSLALTSTGGGGEPTRFVELLVRVRELAERLGNDGEVLLLAPPAAPRSLSAEALLEILGSPGLAPTSGLVDLGADLDVLAAEAARGAECWLLGDPPLDQIERLRGLGVGLIRPGEPHENAGITGLGVARAGESWFLAATIWSTGVIPQIVLVADGAGLAAEPVPLACEGEGLGLQLQVDLGARLPDELEMRIFHREDGFPVDDLARFSRGAALALHGETLPAAARAALEARGWREDERAPDVVVVGAPDPAAALDPPASGPATLVIATAAAAPVPGTIQVRDAALDAAPLARLVWGLDPAGEVVEALSGVRIDAEVRRPAGRGEEVLVRAGETALVTRWGMRIDFLLVLDTAPGLERHATGALPILLDGVAEVLAPLSRGGASGVLDERVTRRAGRVPELEVPPIPRGGGSTARSRDLSIVPLLLAVALAALGRLRRGGGSARGSP